MWVLREASLITINNPQLKENTQTKSQPSKIALFHVQSTHTAVLTHSKCHC